MYNKSIKSLRNYFDAVLLEDTNSTQKPQKPVSPSEMREKENKMRQLKRGDKVTNSDGEEMEYISKSGSKMVAKDEKGQTKQVDTDDMNPASEDDEEENSSNKKMNEGIERMRLLAGI